MDNTNEKNDVKLNISTKAIMAKDILDEWYQEAIKEMNNKENEQSNINAEIVFDMINTINPNYKKCNDCIKNCQENKLNIWYNEAVNKMKKKHNIDSYKSAIEIFNRIIKIDPNFKDVTGKIDDCNEKIKEAKIYFAEKREEEKRIQQEKERKAAQQKRNKVIKKITIAVFIVAIIVGIIVAISLSSSANKKRQEEQEYLNYSANHISVNVHSKSNGESYTSFGTTYYPSNFSMSVRNGCQVAISSLTCELMVTDVSNGASLWSGSVNFSELILANSSKNFIVKLEKTDATLWNYPLKGLKIKLKISSAFFNDYKSMNYKDTTFQTIYTGSSNYKEETYNQAKAYYNNGQYQQAYDLFNSLGSYKDSQNYASICESLLWDIEINNQLHTIAGSNAILPSNYQTINSYSTDDFLYYNNDYHVCFSASIYINNNNASTFVNDFKNKLISNGFSYLGEVDDYNYNTLYVYKKGSTLIEFSSLQEGYSNYYIEYYAAKI